MKAGDAQTMNAQGAASTGRIDVRGRSKAAAAEPLLVGAILITGGLLLGAGIGTIPGLHADECLTFMRVQEIAGGLRPVFGPMNSYTGPFQGYALWPVYALLGMNAAAFRLMSVSFNLAALVFAMLTVRAMTGGGRWWLWAGALLGSSPAFVCLARYTSEVTNIGLLLFFAALYCFARATHAPVGGGGQRLGVGALAFCGGTLLGVSIHNHVIALAVPAALGLALAACFGRGCLQDGRTHLALAGLLTGCLPMLLARLFLPVPADDYFQAGQGLFAYLVDKEWRRLPSILQGIIDGHLIYMRFCGETRWPVVPYASAAVVLTAAGRAALPAKARPSRLELFLLLFWLLLVLMTTLMVNQLSLRYFILPCCIAPLLLVFFLARTTPLVKQKRFTAAVGAMLLGVVLLNVVYTGVNYFRAFSASGGRATHFQLGKRTQSQEPFMETSSHFIGTRRLYEQLAAAGVEVVFAEYNIEAPLRFHDLSTKKLRVVNWPTLEALPFNPVLKERSSAIVYYNLPAAGSPEAPRFEQALTKLFSGKTFIDYVRDETYDAHFLVYVARPASP